MDKKYKPEWCLSNGCAFWNTFDSFRHSCVEQNCELMRKQITITLSMKEFLIVKNYNPFALHNQFTERNKILNRIEKAVLAQTEEEKQ